FEDEVAAIGGPTGPFVAALVAGQFNNLPRRGVHDVNVIVVVGAAPTEGQELAIRRPGWIDDVALVWEIQFSGAGAVGVHLVELRSAAAIADEDNGLAGFRIPGRGHAGPVGS